MNNKITDDVKLSPHISTPEFGEALHELVGDRLEDAFYVATCMINGIFDSIAAWPHYSKERVLHLYDVQMAHLRNVIENNLDDHHTDA